MKKDFPDDKYRFNKVYHDLKELTEPQQELSRPVNYFMCYQWNLV